MLTQIQIQSLLNGEDVLVERIGEMQVQTWIGSVRARLGEHEETLLLCEHAAALMYNVCRSVNRMDVAVALATFLRGVTGKPLVVNIVNNRLLAKFEELFGEDMAVQAWTDNVSQARTLLNKYDEIKNSKLIEKLHSLAMYALSLHIFEKAGINFDRLRYSKIEAEAIKEKFHMGPNLLYCVLDTIVFLCERGVVWMKTGAISSFLHTGDSYQDWYDKCVLVRERSLQLNDPALHGFSEPEFQRDLDTAISHGTIIYEHAKIMTASERKLIGKMLSDMRMIQADYNSLSNARKSRPVPFSLLITGTTGIGKSSIVDMLFVLYGKWFGLPTDEEFMYTRMPEQEYWSGYRSSSWALLLDDMATLAPKLAEAGLDKMLTEIVVIQNNIAYVTNQAAVEDKGRIPLKCQFTCATSNTKHLNAQFVYTYPIAMLRRLPFVVEVKVRPEFASNHMIDPALVPDEPIPDIYLVTVTQVVPCVLNGVVQEKQCTYRPVEFNGLILTDVDMRTFLKWMRHAATVHRQHQKTLAAKKIAFRTLELCDLCQLPGCSGECSVVVQADNRPREVFRDYPTVDYVIGLGERPGRANWALVNENGDAAAPHEPAWAVPSFPEWRTPEHLNSLNRFKYLWLIPFYAMAPWFIPLAVVMVEGRPVWRAHDRLWPLEAVGGQVTILCNWAHDFAWPTFRYVLQTNFPITYYDGAWRINRTRPWLRRAWWQTLRMCCGMTLQYLSLVGMIVLGHVHRGLFMVLGKVYFHPLVVVLNFIGMLHWLPWHAYSVARVVFHMGRREELPIKMTRYVVYLGASAALVKCLFLALDKILSMVAPLESQSVTKEMREPEPTVEAKENYYYKEDFVLTPVDVTPTITSWKAKTPFEIRDIISRNLVHLELTRFEGATGYDTKFRAVGLTDQWYLTNAHNVVLGERNEITVFPSSVGQVSDGHKFSFDASWVHRLSGDLALIKLPHVPPVRRIIELLPSKSFRGRWNGFRLVKEGGESKVERVVNMTFEKKWVEEIKCNIDVWSGLSERESYFGYCGAPYFCETPLGTVLVGIHLLGSEAHTSCAATAVWREDIVRELALVCPLEVQGADMTDLKPIQLHRKDPLRYIESGFLDVYGSLGYRSVQRSSVVDSCLRPVLEEEGFHTTAQQPVLKGWRPNRRALLNAIMPKTVADTKYLKMATQDYIAKLTGGEDALYRVIHPVNLDVALLGVPGIPHLERLNFSTSAGYPHNCTKKRFISVEEQPPVLDETIVREARALLSKYEKGVRGYPIFNACFKDEPTSLAKVQAFKTRVFLISPFAKTLVDRQLFLGHIRFFTENRHLSEMAVGICAQNLEWTQLARHLLEFGAGGLMDGDFAGFDTSQSALFTGAVRDVFVALCDRAGWSLDSQRAVNAAFADLSFAVVNWFGTLIGMRKQNPSGCVITTPINCCTVSIVIRAGFFKLRDQHVQNALHSEYLFSECVHLVPYGDDSVQSVAPKIREWYNQVTLAPVLLEFGFVYTMADKEADLVPFVEFSNLSFLKRKWVWSSEVAGFLAPLEWASIEKMLLVGMRSKSVCEEVRVCSVISSAVREAFFHGRPKFEWLRGLLLRCVRQLELTPWVEQSTFPSYEELRSLFVKSSRQLYGELGLVAPVLDEPAAQTSTQLLLEVQGCGPSRCVGVELSHQGAPQSSYLGMCRLDTLQSTRSPVWVNGTSGLLRPAKRFFKNFSAAIDFARQHFRAVSPELWSRVEKLERSTECACDFCRPIAREMYGCFDEGCEVCFRAFAPTTMCPYGEQISAELYRVNMDIDEANPVYVMQSETIQHDTIPATETDISASTYQGVVGFADKTEGLVVDMAGEIDDVRCQHYIPTADLAAYLERPALIYTRVWSETDATGTLWQFQPWSLFFNNPSINRKLDNYSAISCDLHIKFVVNSSPFFYGSTCISYEPLNHNNTDPSASSQAWFINYSQRPRVWIYASNSQGGQLDLPFFFHKDWARLTDAEAGGLGTITGFVVNQLNSANGVAGAAITIQAWAWATNVKLLGPTRNLAMQSRSKKRDEYTKSGAISSVASAVSSVAKSVEKVPVIGQFATATSGVADMVGDLASLFGFTNPPVLDDVKPLVIKPFANFAATDISTAFEKLSLDSRNEITLDTRLAGLDGTDELAFNSLFGRESYLCSMNFSGTNAVDDVLFATLVRPNGLLMRDSATVPGVNIICSTPLDYFSRLGGYWKGSIIYRFKCVCTPYHRARVRVVYDPVADVAATSPDYVQVFNQVVDIGETTDFEIVVPYMQAVGWLKTDTSRSTSCWQTNSAVALPYDENFDNGCLALRVVTALTGPAATSALYFQVFVRAGPDFEIAAPGNLPTITHMAVQSRAVAHDAADVSYGDTSQFVIGNEMPDILHPNTHLVYHGEKLVSARQLLRRTTYSYSSEFPTSTADLAIYRSIQTPFPPWYGYDSFGRHTANNTLGAGTSTFNYATVNAFNWLAPAFVAYRGSMHWSYNLDTQSFDNPISSFSATRQNGTFTAGNYNEVLNTTATTDSQYARGTLATLPTGASGMSLQNTRTNASLQISVPYHNRFRFGFCESRMGDRGASADGSDFHSILVYATTNPSKTTKATANIRLDKYFCAGPDFNFLFFLNVPQYIFLSIPAAP